MTIHVVTATIEITSFNNEIYKELTVQSNRRLVNEWLFSYVQSNRRLVNEWSYNNFKVKARNGVKT